MKIVPSGSKRLMVAQGLGAEPAMGVDFGQGTEVPQAQGPMPREEEPVKETVGEPVEDEEDTSEDITGYIYKKLVSFGYPERRLDQYEDEFVKEKIHGDGSRELTVTIPDRYYGSKQRLKSEDFSAMVNELRKQFGVRFVDADRSDMKIVMNFTTAPEEKEVGDDIPAEDTLSQVYGPGKEDTLRDRPSKPKAKEEAKAETMSEMLKSAKSAFFDKLCEEG